MKKPRCSLFILLCVLLLTLVVSGSFAAKSAMERQNNRAAVYVADYAFPDEYDYYLPSGSEARVSLDKTMAHPSAAGYKLGETHYEWQHNSSMGRQLEWGSDPACPWTLHADWMYLPSGVLVDRQILYNGWEGSAGAEIGIFDQFQGGGDYAGYPTLDVTADNRAVVGAHNDVGTTGKYVSTAWWQFGCNQSLFSYTVGIPDALDECGNTALDSPGDDDYVWPKIAIQDPPDGEQVLHICASVFGGGSGQQAFGYFQKVGDNSGGTWTFGCAIDTIGNGESYNLATGPDGEIGIAWQARLPDPLQAPCDTCSENATSGDIGEDRLNGDLYMQINRNYGRGIIGTPFQDDPGQPNPNYWENRVNITRHVGYEQTGRNGFRPYSDLSALFTLDGVFHVAYIGMVWEWPDFGTYRCRTFHWSEELGFDIDGIPNIRTVASAQWEVNICNPGAFNNNQAKMSISECDGKLYVMWVELNSPNTTGNENHDDCAFRAFEAGGGDFSGAANGDLFVSVSGDNGLTWDFPRGITDSYGGPTGNPNGACDPATTAGPCPSEHWPSMSSYGTNYAVSLPDPTNVVDIDENPPYSGSHFLDIAFLDDVDPGGAIMEQGDWYNIDFKWVRIPCVEPVSAPGFVMAPTIFDYPACIKHGEDSVLEIRVENTGNDIMTLEVTPEEDASAYSGWLAASGFPATVPSGLGNLVTGDITFNSGLVIDDLGTVIRVTGRVLFDHNAPGDVDTFFVEMIVADTCVLPQWDTVVTNCTELIVSTHGNAGKGGAPGGKHLDYFGDSPDNGEWLAEDAGATPNVYVYDASTIYGTVNDDDTMMYWGMFEMTIADTFAIQPQHDTTALGRVPAHFTETWADGFYTGLYTARDSALGFEAKWYANIDVAYSCGFVIKETKVYSLDGMAHDSVVLGEAIDWDIPSDSASSDNTSGIGDDLVPAVSNLMYQQGTEWEGFNDDDEDTDGGWDETERYGALYYLRGYQYDDEGKQTAIFENPDGMYTASNSKYVYPYDLGFHVDSLFKNHAQTGQNVSDSVDTDLHMGMTYLLKYNLGAEDTLYFYTAYLTTMNDLFPTATSRSSGPGAIAQDAWAFFDNYLRHEEGCCNLPGDANDDESVDISDLTYFVDYMFGGGPGPICPEEFDNDNNCSNDISDLTYYVDYMFGGGPDPMPCLTCPNLH